VPGFAPKLTRFLARTGKPKREKEITETILKRFTA
jgi:hypothetical protein